MPELHKLGGGPTRALQGLSEPCCAVRGRYEQPRSTTAAHEGGRSTAVKMGPLRVTFGVGVRPTKGLTEKLQCMSASSIHIDYNHAPVQALNSLHAQCAPSLITFGSEVVLVLRSRSGARFGLAGSPPHHEPLALAKALDSNPADASTCPRRSPSRGVRTALRHGDGGHERRRRAEAANVPRRVRALAPPALVAARPERRDAHVLRAAAVLQARDRAVRPARGAVRQGIHRRRRQEYWPARADRDRARDVRTAFGIPPFLALVHSLHGCVGRGVSIVR